MESIYHIRVSDSFLEATTMAAIEAYHLGDGRRSDERKLETYGYIWGYVKSGVSGPTYFLDRMSLNLSAKRTKNSVLPNPAAAEMKLSLMERWAPQLSMIGDFHSHPYDDIESVKSINGFEFSGADFESFLSDDLLWGASENRPLMIVTTICRIQRVHESMGAWPRRNLWQFDVGQFRCWINAAVGYIDSDGVRCVTSNTRSPVCLDLNSRFFNVTGDRIAS